VRDLSDSSLIMRLTRGRGWIAVLCALLGGIVALNVISLSLNADAGRLGLQIDRLETQNSALRAEVAERLSASRVETAATTLGLANPDPEEISYLSAKDGDAGKLARLLSTGELLTEPSQPSSYPSAGESYGLAPSSPTTDTTTTTPAPSPAPSPPPSTGTSSGESTGTAPSAPSSGTTGGVGL
jgi:cell division protein FtsL